MASVRVPGDQHETERRQQAKTDGVEEVRSAHGGSRSGGHLGGTAKRVESMWSALRVFPSKVWKLRDGLSQFFLFLRRTERVFSVIDWNGTNLNYLASLVFLLSLHTPTRRRGRRLDERRAEHVSSPRKEDDTLSKVRSSVQKLVRLYSRTLFRTRGKSKSRRSPKHLEDTLTRINGALPIVSEREALKTPLRALEATLGISTKMPILGREDRELGRTFVENILKSCKDVADILAKVDLSSELRTKLVRDLQDARDARDSRALHTDDEEDDQASRKLRLIQRTLSCVPRTGGKAEERPRLGIYQKLSQAEAILKEGIRAHLDAQQPSMDKAALTEAAFEHVSDRQRGEILSEIGAVVSRRINHVSELLRALGPDGDRRICPNQRRETKRRSRRGHRSAKRSESTSFHSDSSATKGPRRKQRETSSEPRNSKPGEDPTTRADRSESRVDRRHTTTTGAHSPKTRKDPSPPSPPSPTQAIETGAPDTSSTPSLHNPHGKAAASSNPTHPKREAEEPPAKKRPDQIEHLLHPGGNDDKRPNIRQVAIGQTKENAGRVGGLNRPSSPVGSPEAVSARAEEHKIEVPSSSSQTQTGLEHVRGVREPPPQARRKSPLPVRSDSKKN
jgi:hypothetical protein